MAAGGGKNIGQSHVSSRDQGRHSDSKGQERTIRDLDGQQTPQRLTRHERAGRVPTLVDTEGPVTVQRLTREQQREHRREHRERGMER